MAEQNQQKSFITPELTHRSELIVHLLEYSNKLVVVKGEQDSGKTSFYDNLLSQEESSLIIRGLSLSISTTVNDVYKSIIEGSNHDELQATEYTQEELNQWLTRCQNKQHIPALLIDNADLFDDELIRQFFDILKNANDVSVLHACLFCEPSFLEQLEASGFSQDDSDTLHIIEMPSLSEKQTEQYIRNNYPSDNTSDLNLFDEKTIKQIHRISHGFPGRINALCEQYLDDPAKETEVVKEKKSLKLKALNIKPFLLKNKLIVSVVTLLMILSIGVATLLHQSEKLTVKQTIKLDLPKIVENETNQDDVVEIEVAKELEPEPVTIDELSPPVIPEIAKDLMDTSGVIVYNPQGRVVAKESDLPPVFKEEVVEEDVFKEGMPLSEVIAKKEEFVETLPEPEPVKAAEPKSEPKVKDINWLRKQDSKKYVLQLIGAYEQETIDVYLKSFVDNKNKIIPFTASNRGKEWHVLVYGLYDNRDAAVAAIETLPTKAKLMAPWPRTVQSIKDLLQ